MSSPASFAEIVEALRQAEAGLEVAVAHKPQTTGFVPSHVLALQIVKGVLSRLPTEAAAMAATVPAGPVYWEYRWKDTHPQTVTSGQWYPWEKVVPRNGHLETVEGRLTELRGYIAQGQPYEIRALYDHPTAEAVRNTMLSAVAKGAARRSDELAALVHQLTGALQHHVEQTRPIERSTQALAAARAGVAGQPAEPSPAEAAERERAACLAALDDVEEPAWYGYECPNTFQDGVLAAADAIRKMAAPKGDSNG